MERQPEVVIYKMCEFLEIESAIFLGLTNKRMNQFISKPLCLDIYATQLSEEVKSTIDEETWKRIGLDFRGHDLKSLSQLQENLNEHHGFDVPREFREDFKANPVKQAEAMLLYLLKNAKSKDVQYKHGWDDKRWVYGFGKFEEYNWYELSSFEYSGTSTVKFVQAINGSANMCSVGSVSIFYEYIIPQLSTKKSKTSKKKRKQATTSKIQYRWLASNGIGEESDDGTVSVAALQDVRKKLGFTHLSNTQLATLLLSGVRSDVDIIDVPEDPISSSSSSSSSLSTPSSSSSSTPSTSSSSTSSSSSSTSSSSSSTSSSSSSSTSLSAKRKNIETKAEDEEEEDEAELIVSLHGNARVLANFRLMEFLAAKNTDCSQENFEKHVKSADSLFKRELNSREKDIEKKIHARVSKSTSGTCL